MAADMVMAPVHPGEILLGEFLKPLAVSQYKLAKQIGVAARRINEIVTASAASAQTRRCGCPLLRHLRAVLDQPAGSV